MNTVPNILTFMRIFCIPIIVAGAIVDCFWWRIAVFFLFVFSGITDYFDGYFARKLKQQSSFGRFLDPIADKALVIVGLFVLASNQTISGGNVIAAVIIIMREIFVSGMREFMAGENKIIPVNKVAKYKTTFQIIAISVLLLSRIIDFYNVFFLLGCVTLWIATILSIFSALQYIKEYLKF